MTKKNHALPALKMLIVAAALFTLVGWSSSWESIRRSVKTIKRLEASFVQTKHLKILRRPISSRGRLFFAAPGSLRWEYFSRRNQKKAKSILLLDRGTISRYIYNRGSYLKDTSTQLSSMRIVFDEIARWLNGEFESKTFNARLVSSPRRTIILTPKEKAIKKYIQRIELVLSPRRGKIHQVKIIENTESRTVLTFSKVKVNSNFPDSLFRKI